MITAERRIARNAAADVLDHLHQRFAAEDVESVASAFFRAHLRAAWLWLEAQP